MIIKFMRAWTKLANSILSSLGVVWIFVEAAAVLSSNFQIVDFWSFIAISIILGMILFLVDGFFISGFLRSKIVISSNGFDTEIVIKFGDIFKQKDWKSISTNDFFDYIVDDKIVSSRSIHGIVINRYWADCPEDWFSEISPQLPTEPIEIVRRQRGNSHRYEIGTTVTAQKAKERFLFVALARTDPQTDEAQAYASDLVCAVRGLLKKARSVCSGHELAIPLFGSGLGRVGLKRTVLLDLILAAVFEETKHGKVTNRITIILPRDSHKDFNLGKTLQNWS